jgi:hypothetical protein
MASSYSRRCRYCRRLISMRQMPAGQWVAFENNEPHDCDAPPAQTKVRKAPKPPPSAVGGGSAEFPDFQIGTPSGPPPPAHPAPRPSSPSPLSGGYRPFAAPAKPPDSGGIGSSAPRPLPPPVRAQPPQTSEARSVIWPAIKWILIWMAIVGVLKILFQMRGR